jgi:hypothetical protein
MTYWDSAPSTSSPGDTPASPSALPENDWALTIPAISGRKCDAASMPSGPVMSWLRTLTATLPMASTVFSMRWKRTVTPQGRLLFRLQASARSTGDTGSGSWRTPSAQEPGITVDRLVDRDGNPPAHTNQRLYDKDTGRFCQWGLTQQVQVHPWPTPKAGHEYRTHTVQPSMIAGTHGWTVAAAVHDSISETPNRTWPTPISGDANGGRTSKGKDRPNEGGLAAAVRSWPTPRHEGFDAGGHRGTTDSLHSAVKAQPWGTPTSRDWKDGSSVENVPENGLLGRQAVNRSGQTGMKLHGRWTLALMGFPPDWCDNLPPDPLGAERQPAGTTP